MHFGDIFCCFDLCCFGVSVPQGKMSLSLSLYLSQFSFSFLFLLMKGCDIESVFLPPYVCLSCLYASMSVSYVFVFVPVFFIVYVFAFVSCLCVRVLTSSLNSSPSLPVSRRPDSNMCAGSTCVGRAPLWAGNYSRPGNNSVRRRRGRLALPRRLNPPLSRRLQLSYCRGGARRRPALCHLSIDTITFLILLSFSCFPPRPFLFFLPFLF